MPLNWYFEWKKWGVTLQVSGARPLKENRYHAFLAGILSGMLTPNLLGNFLGRIYYFKRADRYILTYLTLLGNFSQFLISIIFGGIALIVLKKFPFDYSLERLQYLLIALIFVAIIGYFFSEYLILKRRTRNRIVERLGENGTFTFFKLKTLMFSMFRHFVFTLQFVLMLIAFGGVSSWILILWVWQVYLWVTMFPSLILGKVLIRDSIAVLVLIYAGIGMQSISILVASFLIWLINLLVPTLFALFILKQKKSND